MKDTTSNFTPREQSHTPEMFRREDRDVCFTLDVSNLGIKYGNRVNIYNLIGVLEDHCNIGINWKGTFIILWHNVRMEL